MQITTDHANGLVLVVEDSATQRALIARLLRARGYDCLEAADGVAALQTIESHGADLDAILCDREMPVMDGMALVARLKHNPHLRRLPVVMLTALNHPEQISEGIAAGVFYYLTKPFDERVFDSVLAAAVRESRRARTLGQELRRHRAAFQQLHEAAFLLATPAQAEELASFLANAYPKPERVVNGLAELLLNAVEHGNLELGHQAKAASLADNTYAAELVRRLVDPRLSSRTVQVRFARTRGALQVTIADEGSGFDWKHWLQFDPALASAQNGRGVAYAHLIGFDALAYNAAGNSVNATVML